MSKMSPENERLFADISVITVQVWKHAPYLRGWYSDNIIRFHEFLLLNAKNRRFLWGDVFITAATTVH